MDRRQFLRGLGIFGIGAGASAPMFANVKPVAKDISDKLNSSNHQLRLSAGYNPKPAKYANGYAFLGGQEYETNVMVDMKVGPDGNLYIKTNDVWKQIKTHEA